MWMEFDLLPILLIFLGSVLTKREIRWNYIISVFIIIFLTWNYVLDFGEQEIQKDFEDIIAESGDVDYIITGVYEANELASLSWDDEPYFAWYEDYKALEENRSSLRGYDFGFNSRLILRDQFVISADFKRINNRTYENSVFASRRGEIPGLEEDKCYRVLCTYK